MNKKDSFNGRIISRNDSDWIKKYKLLTENLEAHGVERPHCDAPLLICWDGDM